MYMYISKVESPETHIMTVVTTILGLKLGNVVQPSPYRPADMGWNGANTRLSPYLPTSRLT
ncbi:hypothetical protein [Levilactobacillus fujinensis]|nr:hypothetical protein [Levilactobacillus fujinensis]